ncbi:hypothetical protein P775_10775 [Puniceibacterium antarcticum]|uniref:Methylated-DNA--protein-cysteine methyltransferase n=1 Tax=Puniceibacterium antarcticum TaxID=1206336 RepID=A0A2G8REY0_9RHOB|nr:methylated-DNA--[protein]-cysteine S-methyltransferase [Puniceibacterium antarcticum]PIL20144.1 hypothetical protein P775_10775 [Puniceibacterium antarcticum]
MPRWTLPSPLGLLTVTETEGAITTLTWGGTGTDETPLLRAAARQLAAYFSDPATVFDLPLHAPGSDFQRAVCATMSAIPLGETRTYGDIAKQLGAPAQAVGQACGGNPIPILIPCHRVLGASSLGGFSGVGGIETKVWLLRHEKAAGLLI